MENKITLNINDSDMNDEVVKRAACKIEVNNSSEGILGALLGSEENPAPRFEWVIRDDASASDREYLESKYSKDAVNFRKLREDSWEKLFTQGNPSVVDMLPLIKLYGLPKSENRLCVIFNFFKNVLRAYEEKAVHPGNPLLVQFPPEYDILCAYSDEFNKTWGTMRLLELTDRAGIPYDDGNILGLIKQSENLSSSEKAFLEYIFFERR